MNKNNHLPILAPSTGIALKNVDKALKITNKILANIDTFDKDWDWWLSLSDMWRIFFLKDGLQLDCVDYERKLNENYKTCDLIITKVNIDWFNKDLMKDYIKQILALTFLRLNQNQINDISALSNLTNLTVLNLGGNQISDISILANLTNYEKRNGLRNK